MIRDSSSVAQHAILFQKTKAQFKSIAENLKPQKHIILPRFLLLSVVRRGRIFSLRPGWSRAWPQKKILPPGYGYDYSANGSINQKGYLYFLLRNGIMRTHVSFRVGVFFFSNGRTGTPPKILHLRTTDRRRNLGRIMCFCGLIFFSNGQGLKGP